MTDSSIPPTIWREWREGKVSPYTGKLSARPAGKPGDSIAKENLRRSLLRHPLCTGSKGHPVPPGCVFQAWRNLSVRCGQTKTKPWGGTEPPPAGRPRAQVKERVGRTTPFSSSAMSSGRLFLDRVGRHQSRRVGPRSFTPRPSGPREFHPEPLTDPCLSLSTHTARATH